MLPSRLEPLDLHAPCARFSRFPELETAEFSCARIAASLVFPLLTLHRAIMPLTGRTTGTSTSTLLLCLVCVGSRRALPELFFHRAAGVTILRSPMHGLHVWV